MLFRNLSEVSSSPVVHRAKSLVVDANILVRAVLGRRVMSLLENHADQVDFLTPEVAYEEVSRHLPEILTRRGMPPDVIRQLVEQEALPRLPKLVAPVSQDVYADFEPEERHRLARRDEGIGRFSFFPRIWRLRYFGVDCFC